MEAVFTTKAKEKSPRSGLADAAAGTDFSSLRGKGAMAGIPLFLQRQAEPRVEEEEELDEELPVQTRLVIGQPGDAYEQEADQVADRVMRMPEKPATPARRTGEGTLQAKPITNLNLASGLHVQTKCAACEEEEEKIQTKASFPAIPDLEEESPEAVPEPDAAEQEQAEPLPDEAAQGEAKGKKSDAKVSLPELEPYNPEEEVLPIQTRSLAPGTAQTDGSPPRRHNRNALQAALHGSRGGGSPLAPEVRFDMERAFGRDLSQVRVHTDGAAIQMNRSLNALAFTNQNDIYFNAGQYQPASPGGKHLLAHELTHTMQQGAVTDAVQCHSAPPQSVTLEPQAERPNDGVEVEGRMNEKIANDPNVQDQDELDEEEREAARHPDRGEVRQESNEINRSGESKPSIDRGAAAEEKTTAQQEQIEQELQEQPDEATEEEEGKDEKEKAKLSEADAAAQSALAAEQQAQSIQIPAEPQPFQHPRIEAPVDSIGEPLPRNGQVDTQVRGLGHIGAMLRVKGYEMKRHAAEQEIGSYGLDAVLWREREDLANAKEGTAAMQAHNEARAEIAQQSHEAHGESVERQEFVAAHAPDLASKADEGGVDSGELAAEARDKADQSQSEIPDDEDARADAEQQSGEMQETAQGAESMDQAIRQTAERASQYEQDAATAAEQNLQSETQITATEEIIGQTGARIAEMHAANANSQAQIDNAGPGPALIRQHAQQTAQSGDQLISATIVMEQELNALQEEYLTGMAGIESREAAIQRQQEEQEQAGQAEMSPEEQQLFELAGMSEEEQEQRIAEMNQPQRDGLLAALERMIQQSPDRGTAATEGARLSVDTGLSTAIMGEQPADPRAEQIQVVENRRIQRTGGALDVADQNMNFLTAEQQRMLAESLVAQSITDDIKNINVLQMGKEMLKGMIDPRQSLVGVVGGFEKMLTGFANIGNWEAWQRDPLGNLLQIAADITTGLATIFSSILGIAAIITALMVALTIISWGFLSWFTGPVIAWMGTIMTYAGWGALITGGLAVYFNYLTYIKNLHDAGTAETARELFGNTEQMKQNATDGFQGAMAVGAGVGAVKMGPMMRSGEFFKRVPRSPGQFARQTIEGVKAIPGRIAQGARKLFSGGRAGLLRFKERLQGLFRRRQPGNVDIDVNAPGAKQPRQTHLDETPETPAARDSRVNETKHLESDQLTARDIDAELQHLADNPHLMQGTPPNRRARLGEHEWVEQPNGRWCRHSNGTRCTVGAPQGLKSPATVANQVGPSGKRWDDPSLTLDEFIQDYRHRYPDTTLTRRDLKRYFDEGSRLNPETGRLAKPVRPIEPIGTRESLPTEGPAVENWNKFERGNPQTVPCFPAGTVVKALHGDRRIEELAEGEVVYAYDFVRGQVVQQIVSAVCQSWTQSVVAVETDCGVICSTQQHPFWVASEERWLAAVQLREGMKLQLMDGGAATVTALEVYPTEEATYNLEIAEHHNYFVADFGVLVHNEESAFMSVDEYYTEIYRIKDADGNVIYVGQTRQGGGHLERLLQHVNDPDSVLYVDPNTNRGRRLRAHPDFPHNVFQSERVARGNWTAYEAAVWEQHHIDANGGKENLWNRQDAITQEKFDRYRKLHNPCR